MYKSLQSGRAIASIVVVLYHLGLTLAADKYFGTEIFKIPFSFGMLCIDSFFVLSGFIICTAHSKDFSKPHRLGSYLSKRFIRVFPVFWAVFFAVFFVAVAIPATRDVVPHDLEILAKGLFLIPQDKNVIGGTGAPVITVAWTLHHEVFFYLLFGLLIISKWFLPVLMAAWVGLKIFYLDMDQPFLVSFILSPYLWLFAIGMLVAMINKSKSVVIDKPMRLVWLAMLIFLVVASLTVDDASFTNDGRTLLYGIAAGFLAIGMVRGEDKGQVILGNRWMQLLGNASFVLYLIHYPVLSIVCKLAMGLGMGKLGMLGAFITYFGTFVICVVVAIAFHLWVEKPLSAYLRQRAEKPSPVYA
jgi:peptidoglycan/LPS O-acetylase OafA/YrhL